MSIATKRGDGGQTGLAGGIRVSKTHPRVECYGSIDELISQMGFARSICTDEEVRERVKAIQRELYGSGRDPESLHPGVPQSPVRRVVALRPSGGIA
jgi:cob(I)alamin adenosyltransferase